MTIDGDSVSHNASRCGRSKMSRPSNSEDVAVVKGRRAQPVDKVTSFSQVLRLIAIRNAEGGQYRGRKRREA